MDEFWVLGGPFGVHFEGLRLPKAVLLWGALGSILSTLRPPKVDFGALEGSSWTVGGFKGVSKAKLPVFSVPVWVYFGSILDSKRVYKSESKFG